MIGLSFPLIGTYSFKEDQVISIEPYCYIPFLWQGIQIKHNVHEYPNIICFHTFEDPKKVINQIKETGFQASYSPSEDVEQKHRENEQRRRYQSSPYKLKNVFLFFVFLIIWALLDHVDLLFSDKSPSVGICTVSAFGLLAATSLTTLLSSSFRQRYVLKEGHKYYEMKGWLIFVLILSFLGFLATLAALAKANKWLML